MCVCVCVWGGGGSAGIGLFILKARVKRGNFGKSSAGMRRCLEAYYSNTNFRS